MAATDTYSCARCRGQFVARVADRKRGWARYCSKSCKAAKQEARTGQFSNYRHSGVDRTTYLAHANEFGGIPNFDRNGDYIGFQDTGFSNEEHDCNKDDH